MTVQETLAEGKRLLVSPSPSAFIDTPALDAALLLAETLRTRREELIAQGNEPISKQEREKFFRFLERRRSGECVAYILGHREFRGLRFSVNQHVLVPRPDTEILLEAALEYIGSIAEQEGNNLSLLDLCTGCGALAISLKNERPFLAVSASDISDPALEIAGFNAARLLETGGLSENRRSSVRFIQSDLFKNIAGKFNIIVCNPPYVPSDEINTLAPEVQQEPRIALDGGEDGMDFIRKIISRAPEHLLPGGVLLLEADPKQMPAIRCLLETRGFSNIRLHNDLAGRERVISGRIKFTTPKE